MHTVARPAIIGIDVSRDWLDIHCLPDLRTLARTLGRKAAVPAPSRPVGLPLSLSYR